MTDTAALMEDRARSLRESLAKELEQDGSLRTEPWRKAFRAVSRHTFLPTFFADAPDECGITTYRALSHETSSEEWLRLVYENRTWVTQLDYGATPPSGGGSATGTPTSSSTLPSTVVRMLEDLDVQDGHNVLEVGTGTGYSTALLCARLGDRHVTSVEYDAELSAVDAKRLGTLGYRPTLVVGDGALGHPDRAPYQRIIATYSPDAVPPAWLAQADHDAVLLLSLTGALGAHGYVKLRMFEDGRAEGRFVDSVVSFMPSRESSSPEIGPMMRAAIAGRVATTGRATRVAAGVLDDPAFLWAAQLALPGTIRLRYSTTCEVTGRWFLHPDGAWAVVESDAAGAGRLYEGGTRSLGSDLEAVVASWRSDGRPGLGRYGLTVTPRANVVWLDDPDGDSWTL
ncbi:rRNA adenine N-6-methyltransferase family protein [Embleya hyalina]|uniref:Protein-L-isoaspartate O-methyltransferase n=1 Tax=Embleya hyalina TaxID=516124 RepID=A0A401Z263_9ACTN|nr:rRNA adenine N-6-methyltransferase family protein [Embleya hyalina]GCE00985.1 protein-L-isoaspartate O-methyltransferase [Embleya hyalina]